MKTIIALLSLLSAALAASGCQCPPTGPVLPPPQIPSDFDFSGLSAKINGLANSSLPWNLSTTSFSVEITSADQTVFSAHHTAPVRNETGTDRVDSDTVYRIASMTKVFNVLSLLLNTPEHLDSPISQFVPELRGAEQYEEVTLRMLASQLGGVARNGQLAILPMRL